LSEESAELFRSHDMCHVIFGLDTTFADEAMVDARTLLSCDVGVRKYVRHLMTNPEAKAIFKEVGYLKSIWITILAIPRVLGQSGRPGRCRGNGLGRRRRHSKNARCPVYGENLEL
jgi:hypothetical protein